MSENSENKQEQEVDLIPVFVWIGNGFKNLFNGIGDLLKGIFHFLILFLIFIKKNLILLGVLFVLGVALGFYLDTQSKNSYSAGVRVKPIFGSTSQLFSNISYYSSLAKAKDYSKLAEELGINEEAASKIKEFEIEPSYNNNELLLEYDAVTRNADSVALSNYSYQEYVDAKRDIDFTYYEVKVYGSERNVLKSILSRAVKVNDTDAIKAYKDAERETIDFNIKTMEYQMVEIDSIMAAIQEGLKKKNNSEGEGSTNLYLSDTGKMLQLTDLFRQKNELRNALRTARIDKKIYDQTVNVVSSFVIKGAVEKPHYKIKLAFVFFGLGLLIALLPIVWRFLNDYETKQSR